MRNLHYSLPKEEIKEELAVKGHKVRDIINVKHRITKQPLILFYVDLEPQENNKDTFNINYLNNVQIRVETPNKKTQMIHCTRCQLMGILNRIALGLSNAQKITVPTRANIYASYAPRALSVEITQKITRGVQCV